VQCLATGGIVRRSLFEAVDLGSQTHNAIADRRGIRGILFVIVSPDIALEPFTRDFEIALLGVDDPPLRHVLQGVRSGSAGTVELRSNRKQTVEFGTVLGGG